jgi:hypothetical protein
MRLTDSVWIVDQMIRHCCNRNALILGNVEIGHSRQTADRQKSPDLQSPPMLETIDSVSFSSDVMNHPRSYKADTSDSEVVLIPIIWHDL